CCDQAMTASTANSGSACSHARIASAIPCDTRNWAHSAPQEIRKAETTTAENGQALAQRPPAPAADAPGATPARIAGARQRTRPADSTRGTLGAAESGVGSVIGGVS